MNSLDNRSVIKFIVLNAYILLTFLLFYFVTNGQMFLLVRENGFFQTLTAVAFLLASLIFARIWYSLDGGNSLGKVRTRRNVFLLLLSIVFFIGAGEELSWGQHLIGFEPPEFFAEHNRQGELNIHNLVAVHGRYADGTPKSGIDSYLTISKAFSFFWFGYCVCIPLLALISDRARQFLRTVNMPLVPLWIGLTFPATYVASKIVAATTDARGHYIVEVKESNFALLFFLFSVTLLFELRKRRAQRDGAVNSTPDTDATSENFVAQ